MARAGANDVVWLGSPKHLCAPPPVTPPLNNGPGPCGGQRSNGGPPPEGRNDRPNSGSPFFKPFPQTTKELGSEKWATPGGGRSRGTNGWPGGPLFGGGGYPLRHGTRGHDPGPQRRTVGGGGALELPEELLPEPRGLRSNGRWETAAEGPRGIQGGNQFKLRRGKF